MKIARLFCFLIILGSSAVAAYAQTPVDPTVIVNKIDPGGCGGSGEPICYPGTPVPLVLVYNPSVTLDFQYDPTPSSSKLETFELEFTGVPNLTTLYCQTDIWQICSFTTSSDPGHPGDFDVTFNFFDVIPSTPGPCANDGVHAIAPTCPGFLSSGDGFSVGFSPIVGATPEPGTMLLFGTGLIIFGGVLRRRAGSRLFQRQM